MRWICFGFAEWIQARRSRRRTRRLDSATLGAEEYQLCDGDVVPFPDHPRWTDLLTRELPELAAPSQDGQLVRLYVVDESSEHTGRHRRNPPRCRSA